MRPFDTVAKCLIPWVFYGSFTLFNISASGPVFIKLAETKFCLKSQVLVSNLTLSENKFSLRFGLKLKTGT